MGYRVYLRCVEKKCKGRYIFVFNNHIALHRMETNELSDIQFIFAEKCLPSMRWGSTLGLLSGMGNAKLQFWV